MTKQNVAHLERVLRSRDLSLDCRRERESPPHIMGILNVTPDSFYDGGKYESPEAAVARAKQMILAGAVVIDVGGASSRPRGAAYGDGARPVSATEEMRRIVPVVQEIAGRFPSTWISIDTYLPEVAHAALEAGAHMVNDITGLRLHPELADVAAAASAPMVLMHSAGTPGEMPHVIDHEDVVEEVASSLAKSVDLAGDRGVRQIVVDPGFGFGKSVRDNMKLVGRLDRLHALGRPVLIGISRKSSIGTILGSRDHVVPVDERLFGSLGATAVAALRGAAIIRTHDVRETYEMLKVLFAAAHA